MSFKINDRVINIDGQYGTILSISKLNIDILWDDGNTSSVDYELADYELEKISFQLEQSYKEIAHQFNLAATALNNVVDLACKNNIHLPTAYKHQELFNIKKFFEAVKNVGWDFSDFNS